MLLFSKRNQERNLRMRTLRMRHVHDGSMSREDPNKFLSDSLRTRLQEQVRFAVQSGNYIEPFLCVHDEVISKYYFHHKTLEDVSNQELGYSLAEIIDCKTLSFDEEAYSDVKLFDLIELILVFCKKDKIKDLISRFHKVFLEEQESFVMHGFMIVDKNVSGLRSLLPLIKDKTLRTKLSELYEDIRPSVGNSYEVQARLSADIIQFLFSSSKGQSDTKKYSDDLCKSIAEKWTAKENTKKLTELLSETVKNAKDLGNQISNIRHTDQHSIRVESPSFYKLVAHKNMSIIELTILSLPEKYVTEQNPEEIKEQYLSSYSINKNNKWVVVKKEEKTPEYSSSDDIDSDDIPF